MKILTAGRPHPPFTSDPSVPKGMSNGSSLVGAKSSKEGFQGASAALRHFWHKAATLTSAARCAGVLPASLGDPHRSESLKKY